MRARSISMCDNSYGRCIYKFKRILIKHIHVLERDITQSIFLSKPRTTRANYHINKLQICTPTSLICLLYAHKAIIFL